MNHSSYILRAHGTFTTFFSNLFFQPSRYEEFSSNNFKILYSPNITTRFSTASLGVWLRHLTAHGKILGSNPIETTDFFSIKCSAMYCYNFICNNQEESKCSYSVIYQVKYLCFFVQTRYNASKLYAKYYIIEERCVCP